LLLIVCSGRGRNILVTNRKELGLAIDKIHAENLMDFGGREKVKESEIYRKKRPKKE
jgi:hypothetical protein